LKCSHPLCRHFLTHFSVILAAHTGEIAAGVAGGLLLVLAVVLLVLYRNWQYEQELDSLLWKVDYRDIQMNEDQQPNNGASISTKITRVNITAVAKIPLD